MGPFSTLFSSYLLTCVAIWQLQSPPSFSESNSEAAAKSMLIPGCGLGPGLEPWLACLAYTIPQVCMLVSGSWCHILMHEEFVLLCF